MHRIIPILLLTGILVALCCTPVLAQDVADTIQTQYTEIQSFKTAFTQELTNAASGETEQRNGTIWYAAPNSIRWHTAAPDKELLVGKDDVIWDYFPDEDVAYKYSLAGRFDSKTMLKFITGEVNLKKDFTVKDQGPDPAFSGWTKIRLVPKKPEPSLVMAYIWFEPKSKLIRQVLLVDFFGNGNQLTFTDIQLNEDLDPKLFSFQPPKGVEVMHGGGKK